MCSQETALRQEPFTISASLRLRWSASQNLLCRARPEGSTCSPKILFWGAVPTEILSYRKWTLNQHVACLRLQRVQTCFPNFSSEPCPSSPGRSSTQISQEIVIVASALAIHLLVQYLPICRFQRPQPGKDIQKKQCKLFREGSR